jgi:hypothetical protein
VHGVPEFIAQYFPAYNPCNGILRIPAPGSVGSNPSLDPHESPSIWRPRSLARPVLTAGGHVGDSS